MKISSWAKIAVIIVVCVLLDIVLHLVTSVYSTMPENPNFSIVGKLLGVEITSLLWALLAFSGAAFVFFSIRNVIPGEGVKKGLRYGSAIALIWLFAMLEGVSLFGNPIINEFVVGLSDAIPVFLMGILLSLVKTEKQDNFSVEPFTLGRKIKALSVFTVIFLIGRYIAYFAGVIQAGYQTSPFVTFFWTFFMGACIGVACISLGNTRNTMRLKRNSVKFGFLIFGINWAVFLVFMPLLFSGYLVDVLFRITIDTVLVTFGYYLTFNDRYLNPRDHHRIYEEAVTQTQKDVLLN